ncbi:hypothetical protein BKA67DRAFT_540136 [Truncatella angustata]|uniref:Alcohol dehydrogenase-like C-terminal domain-containing protein n=1 Tax=Truncatella angustata TaxID=152316 RepID=A0A9P8RNW9_9PEZI|nr:uncharacterized protein BKA67DRAFT_540136 [Truncatella angustata]KAH6646631.1 hypothetical protein BKA67DRAFT_540136 [Truncatella angustata]
MACYVNASDFCYKTTDSMDLEEGAMVEPLFVVVAIAKTIDLRAHQAVVVMGCGPIIILPQAVARTDGAQKVIVIDVVQSRLDLAQGYGADGTYLLPRAGPVVDSIDHAENTAGEIKKMMDLGEGAEVIWNTRERKHGLVIIGSTRYSAECYPAAIDLIASGKVDVKKLITNRFKVEQTEDTFELVKKGRQDVFEFIIAGV